MNTESARRRAQHGRPRTLGWRWPLLGLTLGLALTITASSRVTADQVCEDVYTVGRPCTATEEYAFCVVTAMDSYDGCLSGAGWLKKAGCTVAYVVDFWACTAAAPLNPVASVFK